MENRTTIQLSDGLRRELKVLASKRDISYQELLKDMVSVFKELDKEKTIISLPKLLAEKIKNQIENTDFSSVSEYSTYVLRQILSETRDKKKITKKDEDVVKERLRKLGYL